MPKQTTSPNIRFWRFVSPCPNSGCWLWTGGQSRNGYGKFRTGASKSKQTVAHRFSWLFHNGEIPDNALVLHKCDVRACVNPDHLFIGDNRDNIIDCLNKGRGKGQFKHGFDERRLRGKNGKAA